MLTLPVSAFSSCWTYGSLFHKTQLVKVRFDYDALHIACGEAGKADFLLTTDDRMLRLAVKHKDLLQVRVENPLRWLMEVTNDRRD
ncbi:hypothetical protein CEN44_03100 [Fischerella muscicola CCMEE 5323]|uniref:PIN domain-containing protein n=1 Tax=Fischerella muscicola CCMEE 5323 TaxID=2019572 RepID=A0A2N6K7T8_FISMU|nr:hypothetical protein CEN44_03100 [Fischerella muscicola CCMEE 5323]